MVNLKVNSVVPSARVNPVGGGDREVLGSIPETIMVPGVAVLTKKDPQSVRP